MRQGLVAIGLVFGVGCIGGISTHTGLVGAPADGAVATAVEVEVEVDVSFFGVPLGGADDVVFVLDRSGSMSGVSAGVSGRSVGMSKTGAVLAGLGGTIANKVAGDPLPSKMDAAKGELIATLRALPDGTRFGVVFFSTDMASLAPRLWTLDPRTRQQAIAFIRGIKPRGTTAAVPAMRLAYQMGARRVVLLSDGLANNGGGGGDLVADARAHSARGVRIDTVGLGIDQDDDVLVAMARLGGGLAVMR